jgi:uncharacterized protein (TIGR03086 family)
MIELEPASVALAALVAAVRDGQLAFPTPCEDTDVAGLLTHIDEGALACINGATRTIPDLATRPASTASSPADGWRTRVPQRLKAVAEAWRDPAAWTGTTQVGSFTFPGEVAGLVVLLELVLHGWDLARACSQQYECEPHLLDAAYGAMQATVARNPSGIPGVFQTPVEVADDARLLDRLVGLSGRDPEWAPSNGASRVDRPRSRRLHGGPAVPDVAVECGDCKGILKKNPSDPQGPRHTTRRLNAGIATAF